MMKKLRTWLEDAFFPGGVECLCCHRPSWGEALCTDCREEMESLRLTGPFCPRCGYPLDADGCRGCRGKGDAYVHAALRYDGAARQLVHELKFSCVEDAAHVLADRMIPQAQSLKLDADTVVAWAPSPAWRVKERGIDHAQILARCVAERINLPARQLLNSTKRRGEMPQHRLKRAERLSSLRGSMEALPTIPPHVLLVDDVATTGATIAACIGCLRDAGARRITVLTATRTILVTKEKTE